VRLFVAFEIPRLLREAIARRNRALREELPRARWLEPEAMHLTAVFLGEVGGEKLAALQEAGGESLAAEPPVRLRVGEAGSFPTGRPARVVWLAVDSDRDLIPMQRRLAVACGAAAGVEPDAKPFHPHLTLARCAPAWPRAAVERLAVAYADGIGEPFEVAEAILFHSRLGDGPARHEPLQHWALGAAG
jgi:2'-5' RNA ligase